MPISEFDYYKDFSAETAGDFVDSDFTVYDGVLDIVAGLPSGNALSNDPTDATNVVRVGYTAQVHGATVRAGAIRARPDDGSDSTIALTVGSSGAGYNFSSSLGSESCYILRWLGDTFGFYRCEAGAVASITGTGRIVDVVPSDEDEVEFSVTPNGGVTELRGYINGVEQIAYDDPSPLTFTGGVASLSFKGQENLNSSFYGFGVNGLIDLGPQVSLTSGDLQPGGNFTLSYSDFAGIPTSPITLTDSNNNSITVAVTIDDNGDGTGTAAGTMPALPTGASSVNGLLFGDVEVELTT
ncbi:hypothetical protein [Marinobacter salarius]|uniref:hypothetical protein n=1 Tax=Marinobacter salarius TaxID=1420917 RepID=UPI003D0D5BC9